MLLNSQSAERVNKLYKEYPYYYLGRHYHKTHRDIPLEFKKGNYLYYIYLDQSRWMAIIKCTQSQISEYLIVRSVRRAMDGKKIMYVFPTERLRNQFIQERYNKSILYTKEYRVLNRIAGDDDSKKMADSISLKNFGMGTIAFVGSGSENAIVSFAADDIIIDELPLCEEMAVAMTPERQSNSRDRTTVRVGNPLIPDADIELDYKKTDKKIWSIRCSSCGKIIFPDFLEHVFTKVDDTNWVLKDTEFDWTLDRDIYPICDHCNKPFDRYALGEWVQEYPSVKDKSGYTISKIFCTYDTIREIAEKFNEGLTNDTKMQRVYNADFGKPYIAVDSKLDSVLLDRCVDSNYYMPNSLEDGFSVMGIDVGRVYNVVIRQVIGDKLVAVYINTINNPGGLKKFNALFDLIKRYRVIMAIIDGMPESGLAEDFCSNFQFGFRWFRCDEKNDRLNVKTKIINCNRTKMLDDTMSAFLTTSIINPANAGSITDYYKQLTTPVRSFVEEKGLEKKGRYIWTNFNREDHYFFAEAFCYAAYRIYKGSVGVETGDSE